MIDMGYKMIGGFIGLFIILLVLVSLTGIQNTDDYEFTLNKIQGMQNEWQEKYNPSNLVISDYSSNLTYSAFKIIYSFIDFTLYSTSEIVKVAFTFSYENQDLVNAKVLLIILAIGLLAPLIYPLFIIIVSLILIYREYKKNKKEKKELNNIRDKKC